MDRTERFAFNWIGRCQYDNHDKIWGWFFYFQHESDRKTQNKCYSFWSRTGKTPSFKTHQYNKWEMKRLVSSKKDKGYNNIDLTDLNKLWPTFYDDIENRFVLHILKDSI
jgi:hypothetical protein